MMTLETLATLAKNFLAVADELNENVNAYFDGSDDKEDVEAYNTVKKAEKVFMKAYNEYYEVSVEDGLNYDLAEEVIETFTLKTA